MLLCGGLLNILVPCGLGSLVAGCCLRDNQLINTGALQLLLTFLLVGIVWSIVYGIMMLLNAVTAPLPPPVSHSTVHLHEQALKKPAGGSPYNAPSHVFAEGGPVGPVVEQFSPMCGCAPSADANLRGHSRSFTTISPKSSVGGGAGGGAPRRPSDFANLTEVHVATSEERHGEDAEHRVDLNAEVDRVGALPMTEREPTGG